MGYTPVELNEVFQKYHVGLIRDYANLIDSLFKRYDTVVFVASPPPG